MESHPSLIHIVSANRWGGIERYAYDICLHFHNEGWDVVALTKDAEVVDQKFRKSGIPLLHAPLKGLWDFKSIRILSGILKEKTGPTVIHAHGFRNVIMALAARRLSRKQDLRIVMTRHKIRPAIDSWLLRWVYRNIDTLIFVSRASRDRFLSTWYNRELPFPVSRVHVIHNSLNISRQKYEAQTETKPVTAMFHGPLKSGKGLETLIDAMALLKGKRIRLKIVGGGTPDYVDKLRNRAISKGIMELIDWHKHTDDLFPLIRESDFGVLPSVTEEAFGLANIEYMAAGRPQICSSNGAQSEYLTDGWEGFLIPPGNPVFLAETMSKLASDSNLRLKMGERAYTSFWQRLSWPDFISRLENIYS